MDRSARWWLALGWVGFAGAPWYFGDSAGPYGSALVLGLAGDRWWLLPLLAPLLLGSALLFGRRDARQAAGGLIAVGGAGLCWLLLEGVLIGHRGWTLPWLADVWGGPGPSQAGIGYGGFLCALAFLMLLCRGLIE